MTDARSSCEKGAAGEEAAANYLEKKGYGILQRNFRIRRGEVDIIAVRGDTLVFCEVKAWKTFPVESLEYALSKEKRRRIVTAAMVFWKEHAEYADYHARFDVIHIDTASNRSGIVQLEDAFNGENSW